MIIKTICERRIVRLPMELKFQHDIFKVKVDVPDQEVILPQNAAVELPQQSDNRLGTRTQIDVILGSYRDQIKKGAIHGH